MNGFRKMSDNPTIIVQAGGRGSRLRHMTWNKPKCLAAVDGHPILYHLFDAFPGSKFIIIGDYLFDTLERYLEVNKPSVDYELVRANGKGTISGIRDALDLISENSSFYICWSDLIFDTPIQLGNQSDCIVYTTDQFMCRWSVDNNHLVNRSSMQEGIAGLFFFEDKSYLKDLPSSGEFVRWLATKNSKLKFQKCPNLSELGEFAEIKLRNEKFIHHRFFNDVKIEADVVVKKATIAEYEKLNLDEIFWYQHVKKLPFPYIPKVHSTDPLTMSRLEGDHPFKLKGLSDREKASIINNSLITLTRLHDLEKVSANPSDIDLMYFQKTIDRVSDVAKLIPMWSEDSITVNGKKCRNWFGEKYIESITGLVKFDVTNFSLIHGDPTFSNTIVNDYLQCSYIDPRGSFGETKLYGDPLYDFAKVYYSSYGNYDAFNRKHFKVYVDDCTFEVMLDPSEFQNHAMDVFKDFFADDFRTIQILHALIWASLTGYVRDDIDSIIGAYCLATLHFEEALNAD